MIMGRAILEDVARERLIAISEIVGTSRLAEVVKARHEVARRCRDELGYSLSKIGSLLRRHHTTILHATRKERRRRCPSKY